MMPEYRMRSVRRASGFVQVGFSEVINWLDEHVGDLSSIENCS
jgi:hypothetical protein